MAVNSYMQSMVKDLSNMHKILTAVLPKQSIEIIFGEIFRFLMKTMDDYFTEMKVKTKYGIKRIKVDLKFL